MADDQDETVANAKGLSNVIIIIIDNNDYNDNEVKQLTDDNDVTQLMKFKLFFIMK